MISLLLNCRLHCHRSCRTLQTRSTQSAVMLTATILMYAASTGHWGVTLENVVRLLDSSESQLRLVKRTIAQTVFVSFNVSSLVRTHHLSAG